MHALLNAGYCSLSTKISQPSSISYEVTGTQRIKYGRQEQWTQQTFYSMDSSTNAPCACVSTLSL